LASTIELAAQRLAQLQNAGIDVPQGLLPPADPRREETAAPGPSSIPGATPSVPPAAVPATPAAGTPAAGTAIPGATVTGRTATAPSKDPASSPGKTLGRPAADRVVSRAGKGKTSSLVTVDLQRLRLAGMITPDMPRSRIASEFRVIKRPLIDNAQGRSAAPISRANMIMVTSAMPKEGKTFVALNLAMSIAMEMDKTVLLVDGDVISPSVLPSLGLKNRKGLTDLLMEPSLELSDVLLRTDIDRLTLLPAGSAHARTSELITSEAMAHVLNDIATRYPDRIVVFDSPPVLPTTEARVLASQMGQVVMVVHADKTSHGAVQEALALLAQCPVVHTVLNGASGSPLGSYYGYPNGTDTKPE